MHGATGTFVALDDRLTCLCLAPALHLSVICGEINEANQLVWSKYYTTVNKYIGLHAQIAYIHTYILSHLHNTSIMK